MTSPPQPVVVTGGTGGISANEGAIRHLTSVFARAGAALRSDELVLVQDRARIPTLPFEALGVSAGLDPAGRAHVQLALSGAIADLDRAASDTCDLARKLGHAADGYPWGTTALDLGILGPLDAILDTLGEKVPGLGPRTVAGHGAQVGGGDDRIAGWDPRLVDLGVGLIGLPALADLAHPDDDGLGVALATGTATAAAPRTLPDLISGLADVDRDHTPAGIDVRILDGPAGRHVIVDITGTRTFGNGGRHPADLATNTMALGGHDTAYEQGVLSALRQAGVHRGDPVMLVGHSLGGMIAVDTARDAHRTGEFNVTHVVTAGSPISLTVGRVPSSVRVLALENSRDLVPRLDGRPNPDRRNVTTVTSPHGDGSVGGNHSLDQSYVPVARDVQADDSRSVRDFLGSADGYLRADHVDAHSYRVERR